jgi:hypothetical protein
MFLKIKPFLREQLFNLLSRYRFPFLSQNQVEIIVDEVVEKLYQQGLSKVLKVSGNFIGFILFNDLYASYLLEIPNK